MFKKLAVLLLSVSAIFVFIPQFYAISVVKKVGVDTSLSIVQIFGFILLYIFAFGILAWLPAKTSVNIRNLVDVKECPNCENESLSKVHLKINESNDSTESPRNVSLNIEYCTDCDKIWVDGQQLRKGRLYSNIENAIIAAYGNEAPIEQEQTLETDEYDLLVQDLEKAKKKVIT